MGQLGGSNDKIRQGFEAKLYRNVISIVRQHQARCANTALNRTPGSGGWRYAVSLGAGAG